MKERITEREKVDVALVAQALDNTNATGRYFSMDGAGQVAVVMVGGALAATKVTTVKFVEAKDEAGTDAADIAGAAAVVTANAKVVEATIALATVANTDVAVVNGTEFTKAAATDVEAKEFADAAGLAQCINSVFADELVATVNATTVTVRSKSGKDDVTLDKTENAGTITLATTVHVAVVEIKASSLSRDDGFTHIAVNIATTGNSVAAAMLLRGEERISSEQIGALTVL
ncbi:MAG TPA: hypothetical protein VMW87_06760 [Spirochaetia bacterium]|nr:hypothetical protein [Spirochaetia bacterium]